MGKGYRAGISASGDSGVRVKGHSRPNLSHDTSAVGSFVLTAITLNPGVAVDFPWLSVLALCFDMFTINAFSITVDTLQPSSAVGRYALAGSYDYDDTLPASIQSMAQAADFKMGGLWRRLTWRLDTKKLSRPIFHVSPSPASVLSTDRDDVACTVLFATDLAGAVYSMGPAVIYHYDFTFHSPTRPGAQAVSRPLSFKGVEYPELDHLTVEYPSAGPAVSKHLLLSSSGAVEVVQTTPDDIALVQVKTAASAADETDPSVSKLLEKEQHVS